MRNQNKGFSLVELMIVIAVISLLAAIGIPQYSKFKRKAHETEGKVSVSALYIAEKAFHSDYGFYHTSLEAIGYSLEGRHYYNVGFGTAVALVPANFGFVAPVNDAVISTRDQCVGMNGTGTDTRCELLVDVPDISVIATTSQTDFVACATSWPQLYAQSSPPPSGKMTVVAELLGSLHQANAASIVTTDVIDCGDPNIPPAQRMYCDNPGGFYEDPDIKVWSIDSNKSIKSPPFIGFQPSGT
jgi:prepilin-type N-terminal cleavage/methylation domain-containing protein